MYKTKHFKIEELISQPLYELFKISGKLYQLWGCFDDRILKTADALREHYGKAYINNWLWGGNNHDKGFRTFDCEIGAVWSQHKFGRALDLWFENYTSEKIREEISAAIPESLEKSGLHFIRRIEEDVDWLHVDLMNTGQKEIVFFEP